MAGGRSEIFRRWRVGAAVFLTALTVAAAPVTAWAGTAGGGAGSGVGASAGSGVGASASAGVVTKQPTAGYFVGANGLVYVSDTGNFRVQKFGDGALPVERTTWGGIKSRYR